MSSARQFEDLICWQQIHELRIEIGKATLDGDASTDRDFRDEIRNAANAAERHIEDGFGRYKPRVFAAFLEFSRTATCETRSLLRQGVARGHFSAEQFDRIDALAARAIQAIVRFQRYLRSPAAKPNGAWRYQRPYSAPCTVNVSTGANDPNDPEAPNASNDPNATHHAKDPNGSIVLTAERSDT